MHPIDVMENVGSYPNEKWQGANTAACSARCAEGGSCSIDHQTHFIVRLPTEGNLEVTQNNAQFLAGTASKLRGPSWPRRQTDSSRSGNKPVSADKVTAPTALRGNQLR